MKITCDVDKSLPKQVRHSAEERVTTKFSRFNNYIEEVQLWLKDLNGPRGGVDTECLVTVRLRNMPEVIIQERADNIGKAMFNAVDRATRAIARNLQKRTQQYHRSGDKSLPPLASAGS